jgi:hypothetical protein
VIEPLLDNESFTVITPDGTFRFTKAEFYQTFPNVVSSRSYKETGIYHMKRPPGKAMPFRID